MDLSNLLCYSENQLQRALARNAELSVSVSKDADAPVRRGEKGGYLGELRVKGNTVLFVRANAGSDVAVMGGNRLGVAKFVANPGFPPSPHSYRGSPAGDINESD